MEVKKATEAESRGTPTAAQLEAINIQAKEIKPRARLLHSKIY